MAECKECGENIKFFALDPGDDGYCRDCYNKRNLKLEQKVEVEKQISSDQAKQHAQQAEQLAQMAKSITVTTEMSCPDLKIIERKGIVSAEVVVGMNVFKDLFAGVRNFVGGRSGVIQDALRDIRIQVIAELKMEAARSGANAVIAVDLDYQDIGATGSTMLMLVASGTAVVVED